MADSIATVTEYPRQISVTNTPIEITVNEGGVQGPVGPAGPSGVAGAAGTGSASSSVAGVTGINISGYSLTGLINLSGIGGLVISRSGENTLIFSGGAGGASTTNTYINSGSGLFLFQTAIETGISQKFITFPTNLDANANVISSLRNDTNNDIYSHQISGITTSGYWALFSDTIYETGYRLHTYAADSTNTGLATLIIYNTTGEVNTASNVGGGIGVISGKQGLDIKTYSLTGITGISITLEGQNVVINSNLNTGQFFPRSQTGEFYPNVGNPSQFSTSGNVQNTGSNLQSQINDLKVFSRGGTIFHETGLLTGSFIVWRSQFACTVTGIHGYVSETGGATINARKNGSLEHLSNHLLLSGANLWISSGIIQNSSYVQGDKLEIMINSTISGNRQIGIQVDFTKV